MDREDGRLPFGHRAASPSGLSPVPGLRGVASHGAALLSSCGLYRYRLERSGPGHGQTTVIMVNPSTADAERDDATIRKLKGFGERYQWGSIVVGNLFAYRATDVRELATAADPVGPENDLHLMDMLREADRLVVAWGPVAKLPKRLRARWRRVMELVHMVSRHPLSIGAPAKDGHPCHPLMLPYTRELQEWRPFL
jgi:hypothetical protein